jgi:hypothetical protein
LKEIEVRSAVFIDCDNFAFDDCLIGKIVQNIGDLSELGVEGLGASRVEHDLSARLHGLKPPAVEFYLV